MIIRAEFRPSVSISLLILCQNIPDDMLDQKFSVRAHSRNQSRAARTLPGPSDKVETGFVRNPLPVDEIALRVLDLWNSNPGAVIAVARSPDHRLNFRRNPVGKAD